MGIGRGSGETRATDAARQAINSPLLDVSIDGARGVLFAIAGGKDMTMYEIQEAAKVIIESVDPNAKIIFGAIHDDKLNKNEIKITVIASGFPETARKKPMITIESKSSSPKEISAAAETPVSSERQMPPLGGGPKRADIVRPPLSGPLNKTDEDDSWSSIPAFLRRAKKP